MDTSKILEYFDASTIEGQVHIVGCGAVGSHVAEQLARIGVEEVHIWDFDIVEPKNIANQMFFSSHIGIPKVECVLSMMKLINPSIKVHVHPEGLQPPYVLSGYIFMCADSMDVRKAIIKANKYNPTVKGFYDFRIRLTDAQHYFADRNDSTQVENLEKSMAFTQEEALEATPKSACGTTLSVVYTVKTIVALGIHNFICQVLERPTKTMILIDFERLTLDAFPME